MKMKFAGIAAALALGLSMAAPASAGTCDISDVKQNSVNSTACAGAFAGNDDIAAVNAFAASDWEGTAPNPLGGWLFGAKNEDGALQQGLPGVSVAYNEGAGTWSINIGTYSQFILAIKQGNEVAYYYFSSVTTGTGTYNISGWATGGGLDASHISVYVRGTTQVPEPATIALLGLGLLGVGVASRRRKAA